MEANEQTPSLAPPRPATLEEAWAVIDALWAMNQALSQRVAHLEERLNLDSSNSSKPPSSNPPGKKLRKFNRNKADNRKPRGGQPGHPGVSRSLLPPEKVTDTFVCHPAPVCACGGDIHVSSRFLRHQVFEVPEIAPLVWEYHLYQGLCLGCGEPAPGRFAAWRAKRSPRPESLGTPGPAREPFSPEQSEGAAAVRRPLRSGNQYRGLV